jgi:hypothetical protein
VGITVGQVLDPTVMFSAADYKAGMLEVREKFKATGRYATYYMGLPNNFVHQHIFRQRFYEPAAGTTTIAQFVTDWMNGQIAHIGP